MSGPDAGRLGLEVAELSQVLAIAAATTDSARVVAFGSRATGAFRPHSDLDLAVFGSHPLSLRQLRRIQEAFEESTLRFRVDVCDGQSLSAEMRAIVERDAVELFDGQRPA